MTIEFDGQNNKLGTTTANSVTIKTNDTDAITITSSQNVGIGTSSPSSPLHIKTTGSAGTETEVLRLETTGTEDNSGITIDMRTSHINTQIAMVDGSGSYDGNIVFRTASGSLLATPSERCRIDSSGNFLVGTTSTGATTAEDGAYITTSGIIVGRRASGVVSYFNRRSTDGQVVSFYRDTTNSGNISLSGSSTAYNTSSDYRLKENVVEMIGATERLKQLQPKRFNFINELETKDGFLAHEVSDIVPEAITGKKDEVDADGNPVYQGIDQSKLVPLLVASLKEAIAKIEELETRLEALENV